MRKFLDLNAKLPPLPAPHVDLDEEEDEVVNLEEDEAEGSSGNGGAKASPSCNLKGKEKKERSSRRSKNEQLDTDMVDPDDAVADAYMKEDHAPPARQLQQHGLFDDDDDDFEPPVCKPAAVSAPTSPSTASLFAASQYRLIDSAWLKQWIDGEPIPPPKHTKSKGRFC